MRKQLRDGLRPPPAEAAFRRDREILDPLFRRGQALPRAGDAVGVMHQAEAQFGLGLEPQILQRREIGVVGAIARHRHMDQLDRPRDPSASRLAISTMSAMSVGSTTCLWLKSP